MIAALRGVDMKVAYNNCFGGFRVSKDGVLLGRKLSGNIKWGGVCITGDKYDDGDVCDRDYGASFDDENRTDKVLIDVIEALGDKASGFCSSLAIAEIPDGAEFEITYYDGLESVVPPRMRWE